MITSKIAVAGLGFVGGSIQKALEIKGIPTKVYDKYKEIGTFEDILDSDILFLALPTIYDNALKEYDKSAIIENLEKLQQHEYKGCVVLKSTVEPGTTELYAQTYKLALVHNPEFLTARTALEDFLTQSHIVIGSTRNLLNEDVLLDEFYKEAFPKATISYCSSTESECMKLFCNNFYAAKVQIFTEFYLLCENLGISYEVVKDLMLQNGWINPMHTMVPGPDLQISYGGFCFSKDTNALVQFMGSNNVPCGVLEAMIEERNIMRNDDLNVK